MTALMPVFSSSSILPLPSLLVHTLKQKYGVRSKMLLFIFFLTSLKIVTPEIVEL